MTNRQYKLCRIILKKKQLDKILRYSKVSDYLDLQYEFEPGSLDFSDLEMNATTTVTLSNQMLEEYEERSRRDIQQRVSLILSIIAIVISIIALFRP